jgi:ribosome-associated protein
MTDKNQKNNTLQDIEACCQALDDTKADNILVLYLGEKSSITDYYIIASGMSKPHLKALSRTVDELLDEREVEPLIIDSVPNSGWVIVDAFDFMVHIFIPEQREYYNLESLWKDAEIIEVESLKSKVEIGE